MPLWGVTPQTKNKPFKGAYFVCLYGCKYSMFSLLFLLLCSYSHLVFYILFSFYKYFGRYLLYDFCKEIFSLCVRPWRTNETMMIDNVYQCLLDYLYLLNLVSTSSEISSISPSLFNTSYTSLAFVPSWGMYRNSLGYSLMMS